MLSSAHKAWEPSFLPVDAVEERPSRRTSWIHSFSSKFVPSHDEKEIPRTVSMPDLNSHDSSMISKLTDSSTEPPKTGFFSSLRRLSSSKGSSFEPCKRKVMNKNTTRQTCPLQELNCVNLKRVGFRVDLMDDETLAKEPLYIQIRKAVARQTELAKIRAARAQTGPDDWNSFAQAAASRDTLPSLLASTGPIPSGAICQVNLDVHEAQARARAHSEARARRKAAKKAEKAAAVAAKEATEVNRDFSEEASIVKRRNTSSSSSSSGSSSSPASLDSTVSEKSTEADDDRKNLQKIYARCCKLREHAPLPYIQAQLAGKRERLEHLRICVPASAANDYRTLCDMQVIADFITIIPISSISLDNATLCDNVVTTIMAAIKASSSVKILSFRGTKLTSTGWKVLCYFLTMNKSVISIDLSKAHRKPCEWMLLVRALEVRNGIAEIGVDESDIPDRELAKVKSLEGTSSVEIRRLADEAVAIGVAQNELEQCSLSISA